MNLSHPVPAHAGFDTPLAPSDRAEAPRLVILQPRTLCAQAIEAAVHKHTRWHVACATTELSVAIAAALSCRAQALLFDVRSGNALSITALIRSVRHACPNVPLILLTEHEGRGFLKRAATADLSAIMHKRDSLAAFRTALDAVQTGHAYHSALILSWQEVEGHRDAKRSAGSLYTGCL